MALIAGDPVLPFYSFDGTAGSPSPLVFGAGVGGAILANTGAAWNAPAEVFREVAPGTSGLFGACVQVTGGDPARRGTVIAELQIELGTEGGTGALTECVLVQPSGGSRFLARVADVQEVPC
jgi:hypothetical protein